MKNINYTLDPNDLKIELFKDSTRPCEDFDDVFMRIIMTEVKVTHMPTRLCVKKSSSNKDSAIKDCIEELEWEVYYDKVMNNKHNYTLGGK